MNIIFCVSFQFSSSRQQLYVVLTINNNPFKQIYLRADVVIRHRPPEKNRGTQAPLALAAAGGRSKLGGCCHKILLCISLLTMRTSDKWSRNIKALEIYVSNNGHALVPASTKVEVDGIVVSLGAWISYLRMKNKAGTVQPARRAQLEAFPQWTWGPCRPGPTGDIIRDNVILMARTSGRSLQSIADEHNLSRQRVHQILRRINKPSLANA